MSQNFNENGHAAPRVCLDLGTAMSKASVWLGGDEPKHSDVGPLPIGAAACADHPLLVPSAMYVDDDRVLFGPAALHRAQSGIETRRNPIVSFKMILSAREIEPTLALKVSRSVDPTSTLRHRDALVLYLAYLDQLIRAAIAAESIPAPVADAPRRLTSPHWPSFAEAYTIVGRLVDEASVVSTHLGAAMLDAKGILVTRAKEVLEAAEASHAYGHFEGAVFESHSAASAYAHFARSSPSSFILVIDMGAGTTDIAGFEREHHAAGSPLTEIDGTRQCSTLAGDELDSILVDLFMRAGGKKALAEEDKLWRAVNLSAKALKHELLRTGKGAFKQARNNLTVRQKELADSPTFKAYCLALTRTFETSLLPLLRRAKQNDAAKVSVLLAGGGSNMPFLADLVRTAAARCKIKVKITIEKFGANWALPHKHHPLTGVFPQMAISMGGALAPLAAHPKPTAALAPTTT